MTKKQKMKMSELLERVGDENIRYQIVRDDMRDAIRDKSGSSISFYTDPAMVTDLLVGTKIWTGLVIWVQTDLLEKIQREME